MRAGASMTPAQATLSHAAARALYDRIGRWQDTQRFYEDYATADVIAHADLRHARSVFEFGVGTGRIAERLLRDELPATARYRGIDISATMVALARERLSPWRSRAVIEQSDGSPRIQAPEKQFDRFLSTYVLDLLSPEDITLVVEEAHRLLSMEGLLCLVSATYGRTPLERFVMGAATRLHSLSPNLVGGCRAIDLLSFLRPGDWGVVHRNVTSKWGIASEVLVARPR
ncbi:MAG: methyltransferase domain-containing protein [Deltaproteobacteria bacterium]|nr:MAG: methyltransferase domain-containing protein [Deltaproteobacteria bacterium]TMA80936.1 MAG: methyltransferase domain-containing protein [Deltaproteobacteria bacterium]